jgi:spermidine/putrescine transport system permease protein
MSTVEQIGQLPAPTKTASTPTSGRLRLLVIGLACLLISTLRFVADVGFIKYTLQALFFAGLIFVVLGLIPNRKTPALPIAVVLAYTFLYAPILVLIIFSFNASRNNANWTGFTLSWYEDLLKGGAALALSDTSSASMQVGLFQYVRNSLIVAFSAMLISTMIGTLVALGMERYRFKLRSALDVVLYLPIIIPDVAMGIAMAVFFNLAFKILERLFGIDAALGFPTIIISHVAFNISFVSVVVRARLAGMDPALEEAAYDSGANEWQTFRRIILPLIAPGIIGGALLAFTLSLDDYVITFFTAGVGTSTLPIYVFGLVRFSVTPAINALSTLMMLFSMIIVTLSLAMQRR